MFFVYNRRFLKMGNAAKGLFKIVLGLIIAIIPIYLFLGNIWGLWSATWALIKGGIALLVLLIGLIFILIGFSDIK